MRRVNCVRGAGRILVRLATSLFLVTGAASTVSAQQPPVPRPPASPPVTPPADTAARDTLGPRRAIPLAAITVTATRGAREIFFAPASVTVIDSTAVARHGAGLLRHLASAPGVTVEGVGAVRQSPMIRGLRGQRILLLEDGMRLNNSRRDAGRGEPLSLAWLESSRVEVLRGPASVLYGSDAIGGVINVIPALPRPRAQMFSGRVEAGASSNGGPLFGGAMVDAGHGNVALRFSITESRTAEYRAPAGRVGDLVLASPVRVEDSGADSRRLAGMLTVADANGEWHARHADTRIDGGGFGFVEPGQLGSGPVRLRIHMPEQSFRRTTVGYRGRPPITGVARVADHVDVAVYTQRNRRDFITEVATGPVPPPPGTATVTSVTGNFSDVVAHGARVEARTLLATSLLLTWGVDGQYEHATNRDSSRTTVYRGDVAQSTLTTLSRIPDADLTGAGAFAQAEWSAGTGTDLSAGVRYQWSGARTRAAASAHDTAATGATSASAGSADGTGGANEAVRHDADAVVGAVSVLQRLPGGFNVIASVARGFRSPNLVERFYSGPTPKGGGTWVRNPELGPETSVSMELGMRYRSRMVFAEAFVFRNTLSNAIQLMPTGREVNELDEYRNENVERVRIRGVEVSAGSVLGRGVSVQVSHATSSFHGSPDFVNAAVAPNPVSTALALRLAPAAGVGWAEYSARRTGDLHLAPGRSIAGEAIGAHVVHDVRVGVNVAARQQVLVEATNLFNRLYAEPANLEVFRPSPGRAFALRMSWAF
jgi:hemoglobin/transferrin/lactoferrin receptor protein